MSIFYTIINNMNILFMISKIYIKLYYKLMYYIRYERYCFYFYIIYIFFTKN